MTKNKLKSFDLKYFVIPFLALLVIFVLATMWIVDARVEERLRHFSATAASIADSYAQMIDHSEEAYQTISELVDEKLAVASEAIMLLEQQAAQPALGELARRLQVDEIYRYDVDGMIVSSNTGKYIGWQAYPGHPVHAFMISDKESYVEDFRPDTESGIYYKYAYI